MNYKNNNMRNFHKIIALAFIAAVTFSCVGDDDFNVPNFQGEALNLPANSIVTINGAKNLHEQEVLNLADDAGLDPNSNFDVDAIQQIRENTVVEFGEAVQYLEGYVISSDAGGNFFEEVFIQNAPENPSSGARISIDVNPLFTSYAIGQRIYVNLQGLAFGIDNGVYSVGVKDGNEVEQIAPSNQETAILRDNLVTQIVPREISITDFDDDLVGTYITINDLQFKRSEVIRALGPKTFAGEASDTFQGERVLESCANGATAIFSSSTFADFKAIALPVGKGTFEGVLTYNFFGDTFNLKINRPEGLNFTDSNRCDPDFLDCGTGATGGSNILLSENFETIGNVADLTTMGWTNINVSGGSESYELGSFSGSTYLQINAFGQSDDPMIAYLVTPAMNFDNSTDEELNFDIQANFDNGGQLEVLISNNYTGDPLTTTWQNIDAAIPAGPSGGFGSGFTSLDPMNVSCIDGTDVRIAFRYTGSDPQGTTTRYHIDNFEVSGN